MSKEQDIFACYYCDTSANDLIICPKCNKNICYSCLMLNYINCCKYLCPNCNNDLHNFVEDIEVEDKIIDEYDYENECVICYDTFDENNLIRCIHNHPYCRSCYKHIMNSHDIPHTCGICRCKFQKKHHTIHIRTQEHPFNIYDKVIKCKYCHEHFEYDTLISYFTSKLRYDKNYYPECIHCHQNLDNKFMYDNFDRDFCKDILKLIDPYACKYCQKRSGWYVHCKVCRNCMKQYFQSNKNTHFNCPVCNIEFTPKFIYDNFKIDYCKNILHIEDPYECKGCHKRSPEYTCKYCQEKICITCAKNYFEEKVHNHELIDCMNCHHPYTEFDLYDDIFKDDNIYVKDILNVKNPYECGLCHTNLIKSIKYIIRSSDLNYINYISCEKCKQYFCKDCLYQYLKNLATNYKNNTKNFRYVPEGVYKCPCCEVNFSKSFLHYYYSDYYHDCLYLFDKYEKCSKCHQNHYCILRCYRCQSLNCLDCLCEEQKRRIIQHPDIDVFNKLQCIDCGRKIIDEKIYWTYLDDDTCKNLKLETKSEYECKFWYKKNSKHCPKCGNIVIYECGSIDGCCYKCFTIFEWKTLKIIETTCNKKYLQWNEMMEGNA